MTGKKALQRSILCMGMGLALLRGQDPSPFYFNLSAIQEYQNNIYRLPDSLEQADYSLNTFIRTGWRQTGAASKKATDIYYENRLRRFNNYQSYNRLDHILFGHSYRPLGAFGRLILNERYRFRNYYSDQKINSYRNIMDVYWQTSVRDNLQVNSGYRGWLKRYPNTADYQNYSSYRLFLNFYFSSDQRNKIGFQNELNWHNGNLYPYGAPKLPDTNLFGFRYTAELSSTRIVAEKYFLDLRYRFEWDNPQEIDQYQGGDYSGDYDTEELLAEDSDFDYTKHQLSVSVLHKSTARLSIFCFGVLQTKHFRHWRIAVNGPLRNEVFGYFSLTAKYTLSKNVFAEFYFNVENNDSNHPDYDYSRAITGLGLRYSF